MNARPVALGAITTLVVVGAAAYVRIAPRLPVAPVPESEFDCPHSPGTIALAGAQADIPEFNDCQQFIDEAGSVYLEKAGIYVRQALAATQWPVTLTCTGGPTADPLCGGLRLSVQTAVAVAVVRSWQAAKYNPLGIEPGYNCLYVVSPPVGGTTFSAKMVPVADQADCQPATRSAAGLAGMDLQVIPTTVAGVPAAARWAWDPKNKWQYVVMACQTGWCAIGRPGFEPGEYWEEEDPEGDNVLAGGRFTRRPGNDIQRLAILSGTTLTPGPGWGIAVPEKGASAELEAFHGKWVRVASLALTEDEPKYEKGLNLGQGKPSSRMTTVELCGSGEFGGADKSCPMPFYMKPFVLRCDKDPSTNARWVARINSHLGGMAYRCVTRTDHGAGVVVPATVRWRWVASDEAIWSPCGPACCKVETGFN